MSHVELACEVGDAVGLCGLVHRRNAERFRTVCGGRGPNLRGIATFSAGRPIRRLVVTHHHPDHAGLASWLTERTGAEFWMPQAEYFAAHAMREGSAGFGFDNVVAMFVRNGLSGDKLELMRERRTNYRSRVPGFPSVYRRLMDGQVHRIGGRHWEVVIGYGHAPEHAALYCEEQIG